MDVNGEPYELVHLPKMMGTFVCKVNPLIANFTALGITEQDAQGIVDMASAMAKAME